MRNTETDGQPADWEGEPSHAELNEECASLRNRLLLQTVMNRALLMYCVDLTNKLEGTEDGIE